MSKSEWLGWGAVAIVCFALFGFNVWRYPPYSFHPLCTYDLTYRLQVILEAGGKQYSSEVVRQRSHSRIDLFSADCQPTHGVALTFRLDDNRLVMLSSGICQAAERALVNQTSSSYAADAARAMKQHRKVDVASFCIGSLRDQNRSLSNFPKYDGFLIDNADKPSQWVGFRFGDVSGATVQFRIVSAIAEAADISPKDDLDKITPGILKTDFKYTNGSWSDSPEVLISFSRRYSKSTYVAYQQ